MKSNFVLGNKIDLEDAYFVKSILFISFAWIYWLQKLTLISESNLLSGI